MPFGRVSEVYLSRDGMRARETIIEIISTMADDPDKYRAGLKVKLLELADTMPLAAMAPMREDKVRAFVRETINTLLSNKPPN
jgi:hypothetical protein